MYNTNFRFLKSFDHFLNESYYANSIILRPGDLSEWDERCINGESNIMCDLIKDLISYGIDKNVKKMHKVFADKWSGVETIENENFLIYRGFSPMKNSPLYKKWNQIYESGNYVGIATHEDSTYTSWSVDKNIAESYANTRKGDIKVMLSSRIKDLKTLANLFEIGDESEEVIIYPFKEKKIQYHVWKN